MEEKEVRLPYPYEDDEEEIDILEIFEMLLRNWKRLLAAALAAFVIGLAFGVVKDCGASEILPADVGYESTAMLYISSREDLLEMYSGEAAAAPSRMASTAAAFLQSETVLRSVCDSVEQYSEELGFEENLDYSQLSEYILVSGYEDTQLITIRVRSPLADFSRTVCKELADTALEILPQYVDAIDEVKIISPVSEEPLKFEGDWKDFGIDTDNSSSVTEPTQKSAKDYLKYAMIFAVVGFLLAVCWVVLPELFSNKLKTTEDIDKKLVLPVLGVIPNYTTEAEQV